MMKDTLQATAITIATLAFGALMFPQVGNAQDVMRYNPQTIAGGAPTPQSVRDRRTMMEHIGPEKFTLGHAPVGATVHDNSTSIGTIFEAGSSNTNIDADANLGPESTFTLGSTQIPTEDNSNTHLYEDGSQQTQVNVDSDMGDFGSVSLETNNN